MVLVVEDDDDIRDTIVELLADAGLRAYGAANGSAALDVLRTLDRKPCMIFLDLMMPILDGRGFRAAQLANPEWAGIPVILISAYADVAQHAAALGLEYMAKPLGVTALLDAVRRHCGQE